MPTVDTLQAFETLIGADVPEKQAKAIVSIVHKMEESFLVDVATKADLRELELRLKHDLTMRFGAMLAAAIAVVAALVKLL